MHCLRKLSTKFSNLLLRDHVLECYRLLSPTLTSSPRCLACVHSDKSFHSPKRPVNAFVMWMMANRTDLQKEQPGIKAVGIMKLAGQKWKILPPLEKQAFFEKSQENRKRYVEEKKMFEDSMTAEEKEEYKNMVEEKKHKKEMKKKSMLMRRLGKPKRPTTAFACFLKKEMNDRPAGTSVQEYMKQLGNVWRDMSDTGKKPFIEEFHEDKERYEDEIKVWETQMKQDGYSDLVRHRKKSSK